MNAEREYLPFLPGWTLPAMYAVVVAVAIFTIWQLWRRYLTYRVAATEEPPAPQGALSPADDAHVQTLAGDIRAMGAPLRPRLARAFGDVFLQRKVRERMLPAALHLPIFYGMILLFIGTTLVFVDEDILRLVGGPKLMRGGFYAVFEAVLDTAGLALFVGVCIALYRRLVIRPAFLLQRRSTLVILAGLLFMAVSGFALEGFRIALHPNEAAPAAFVGSLAARLFDGATEAGASLAAYRVLWWLHLGVALGLIAAVGMTGLSHLLTIPGVRLAQDPRRPRVRLTTPFNLIAALESDEEIDLSVGTASTAAIAPSARLAADACMACGRCHAECPAVASGRALSPRDLTLEIQRAVRQEDPPKEALSFEAAVWACTNCYACEAACPAGIRHVDFVLDFRRALVDGNRLDEQKLSLLQGLERNLNPFRLPSHERAAWLTDIPWVEEAIWTGESSPSAQPPDATAKAVGPHYLYWLGCTAAYDERAGEAARATMELLRLAGVAFTTLGPAEACCGEPAKRLGEEGRFQMLAMTNMELLRETGADIIVASCPHCLNALSHEYGALGFDIPVKHHSEVLAELVTAGRVRPAQTPAVGPVVLHEPCNLARAGRPDQVARLLTAAGSPPLLPPRSGERTFCCGGGAGNMWYSVEPETERISRLRMSELAETLKGAQDLERAGAPAVVTACPYCLSMLGDAARTGDSPLATDLRGHHTPPPTVVDVAEILWQTVRPEGNAGHPR